MKLKELEITLETYGPDKGKYKTRITFGDDAGEITLLLNPEVSQDLLTYTSGLIRKYSTDALTILTDDLSKIC